MPGYLRTHDSLTGVYNRCCFDRQMQRLAAGCYDQVCIIICDIDGLKVVNHTLGRQKGDCLLMATATAIKNSLRQSDFVARIGSDEFAVLLPNCAVECAELIKRRIKKNIEAHNLSMPDLHLNISIGYASGPQGEINEVLRRADDNMCREKLLHQKSSRSIVVQSLLKALEARDGITEGHVTRLQQLIISISGELALPDGSLSSLLLLAVFHDIGKVGIPDRILNKPGLLTEEEYSQMKRHCEIGSRIACSSPDLEHISELVLKHHEWWNGNGYPLGLKETEIPLECRILAVADAYDAMTSHRPYRRAMSHQEAVAELKRCAGSQFDPDLVPRLIEILEHNASLRDSSSTGQINPLARVERS